MYAQLTAPRGHKTATVKALRAAGCSVSAAGSVYADFSARDNATVLDLCRRRFLRPEKVQKAPGKPRRLTVPDAIAARALTNLSLETACLHDAGKALRVRNAFYAISGDAAVAEILRRVGPAGEQARADEARYFETFEIEQYKSSRHWGKNGRGISLAVVAPDASASILSFAEWTAASVTGRDDWNDRPNGGLRSLRFAVYLVVRDTTSGERHVLRLPPRFGRYTSATFCRYLGDAGGYRPKPSEWTDEGRRALIHAALAWTFGLKPDEYCPDAEA